MAVRLTEKVTRLTTRFREFFRIEPARRYGLDNRFYWNGIQNRIRQSGVQLLICLLLGWSLIGCASQSRQVRLVELPNIPGDRQVRRLSGPISEVAPPAVFSDLAKLLPDQQPQVAIAAPKQDQVIEDTHIDVQLNLQNFSIYKDENTELGPHIQIVLDNQPARSIYSLENNLEDMLTFDDLAPGSHTLRAIAVQPWGESFKNETAYAQTTFHVFAKTGENTPNPDLPLLTFIEPQGTVNAEPMLLDFYLTNAPLHFLAQENAEDELPDWKIRGTVNGRSFVFDQWRPIYLKGFEPGKNWIQLTLIDDQGDPIENAFNSTVKVIDYDPTRSGALAKLVRGELPLQQAGQIIDPTYQPPAEEVVPSQPEAVKTDRVKTEPLVEEPGTEEFKAEESEAESIETEGIETEETETEEFKGEELELDAGTSGTDVEALQQTAPEIANPKQSKTEAEETEVKETEIGESEASQLSPVEPIPSPVPSTETTKAVPEKRSLFKKLFGKKDSSQASEPATQKPRPTDSDASAETTETNGVTVPSPSEEFQLEPAKDTATSEMADKEAEEETGETFNIPTDLSAPAAPTEDVLAPEQTESPAVLEESDIEKFDAADFDMTEKIIDAEPDGDEIEIVDEALKD